MATLQEQLRAASCGPLDIEPGPYTQDKINALRGGGFRRSTRPVIRFWAADPERNGIQLTEATMMVSHINVRESFDFVTYEVQGRLIPPVIQHFSPAEDHSEPQPVTEIDGDMVSADLQTDALEGFQPLGRIMPDDVSIDVDTEYTRAWGGRTVKVSENYSVSFDITDIHTGPAITKLFGA